MKTPLNYNENKLDKIDYQILEKLQKRANMSKKQLAKEIDLSPAATYDRVRKLENLSIIKDYHAEINPNDVGFNIECVLFVTLSNLTEKNIARFKNEIEDIDEIMECYHVTGSSNIFLKIIAEDIPTLENFIFKQIADLDYVTDLKSMIVLSALKKSKLIPIRKNV